ncbi:amino acid ABC transporter ATP-binding protein [Paenarthrobacter ilicis]|uniref:amino acid ABC transporter ATP-binding protein n=1 Tax=Paenarthrobacter ilicis TaxID=43665 RepID=UPI0028D8101B|nr:amino acid ABC transporter ATP-binding protein [Paenarthrobacter ilicis]
MNDMTIQGAAGDLKGLNMSGAVRAEPILVAEGVTKSFGPRTVLKSVSFEIAAGEIGVLIGKSGSGKSTLLRIFAGLDEADAGNIHVRGTQVVEDGEYTDEWDEARSQIGMIFQHYTLWPHMTVLENLALAPRLVLRESRQKILERAKEALAEVGMSQHLHSRSPQLSGGERQRVAIARALMMRPKVLLCDEITSALDPPVAAEVLGVITKLKEEEGIGAVLVTHDMAFASKAADKVLYFEEGVVAEEGPPSAMFTRPQTPGLQQFVDAVRF